MNTILLQIKDIVKTYSLPSGQVLEALKRVNLTVYEGEIISLLGVNGAGKTTLSSIMATLIPATSGELLFKGVSVYADIVAYRMSLGLCPQRPNFNPSLTLEQNLYFAGKLYGLSEDLIRDRMHALVKQFDLARYLKQKAVMLSGGYKQRFLIARTLMHKPQLVIFDEPTVALDPHVRHQLWDFIKGLKSEGVSVILTTHYLDEAEELSDRVCLLDQGAIKLIDTPENLKAKFNKDDLEAVFIELIKQSEADRIKE